MADMSTLARPYAKAAFDFANEQSAVDEWENFLLFSTHAVRDKSFVNLLNNPSILAKEKAKVLLDAYKSQIVSSTTEESPLRKLLNKVSGTASQSEEKDILDTLQNFVLQLSENGRLGLMPQIYEHYRYHKSVAIKQMDAYVTTAYPLTDIQRALIQTRLASSMNATIVLHESVDESLMAGATIKVGDKIVDDSIRGKLKQLKTQLSA